MRYQTGSQCHKAQRKSVDLTERRKQQDQAGQDGNSDLLEQLEREFQRTLDSGDPFESLTRTTKRFWRGLID